MSSSQLTHIFQRGLVNHQPETVEIRKYLLREESFWHNYLELLPETEEIGASFTWTDDDLELLSGTGCWITVLGV